MNHHVNHQFITITQDIFSRIFDLNPVSGDPYTIIEREHHPWDISGFIAVAGPCQGVVAVRLTQGLAIGLLSKSRLFTSNESEQWQMVNDMIGELVNTITGNVLSSFKGNSSQISVPFTVQGKDHYISQSKGVEVVGIPFTLEEGRFEIEFSLLFPESGCCGN